MWGPDEGSLSELGVCETHHILTVSAGFHSFSKCTYSAAEYFLCAVHIVGLYLSSFSLIPKRKPQKKMTSLILLDVFVPKTTDVFLLAGE